ncbi:MAG: hypothetical protein H0A75_03510 [Candidatus Methanofishera endochildressiae]|uniref:Uncharacterized protein n=1 Tax=Candidatus Methanofishera endochildressiae TaxID=2738884 RepID=A0A7Z0MN94_9GAMM|nr:hypothetical protein [Candidatus Methanofishera endochildressiae]
MAEEGQSKINKRDERYINITNNPTAQTLASIKFKHMNKVYWNGMHRRPFK